jgi:hypothetical protein
MTVLVTVEMMWLNGRDMEVVVKAPPIVRPFIGQPLEDLIHWMRKQGNFRMEKL